MKFKNIDIEVRCNRCGTMFRPNKENGGTLTFGGLTFGGLNFNGGAIELDWEDSLILCRDCMGVIKRILDTPRGLGDVGGALSVPNPSSHRGL